MRLMLDLILWQPIQYLLRYFTYNHKSQPQCGSRGEKKGIAKAIRLHHLQTMNICPKIGANQFTG